MDSTILLSTNPTRQHIVVPRSDAHDCLKAIMALARSHPHAFYPSSQAPNKSPPQDVLLFFVLRHSNRRGVAACHTSQSVKARTYTQSTTGALPTAGVSFAVNVAKPYRQLIVVLKGKIVVVYDFCLYRSQSTPSL